MLWNVEMVCMNQEWVVSAHGRHGRNILLSSGPPLFENDIKLDLNRLKNISGIDLSD